MASLRAQAVVRSHEPRQAGLPGTLLITPADEVRERCALPGHGVVDLGLGLVEPDRAGPALLDADREVGVVRNVALGPDDPSRADLARFLPGAAVAKAADLFQGLLAHRHVRSDGVAHGSEP